MLRPLPFAGAAVVAVVAALAFACSSGSEGGPAVSTELTQKGEAAGITVEATWLTEQTVGDVEAEVSPYPLDDFVLVTVGLDTHSGDLGEIDLAEAALLRQSGQELTAEAWLATSDDSHHRAGVLVFPRRLVSGPVELSLTLAESDVVLAWEEVPAT